jgi:hypothetical protein
MKSMGITRSGCPDGAGRAAHRVPASTQNLTLDVVPLDAQKGHAVDLGHL